MKLYYTGNSPYARRARLAARESGLSVEEVDIHPRDENLDKLLAAGPGGKVPVPMVLMASTGAGYSDAAQHSQCLYGTFAHLPGMKVVVPSNAYDAKGLMTAAIRDDNPVVYLFHKALQGMGWLGTEKGATVPVPDEPYIVEIGKAKTVREGRDVTVYCYGAMVPIVEKAAEQAKESRGIDCLVVDLRTLLPLDEEGVLEAAKQTGRVVVVHEAPRFCGYGAEISALIAEHCIEYMEAPVKRVTGFDTPFPNTLEHHYLPDDRRVLDAIESVYDF